MTRINNLTTPNRNVFLPKYDDIDSCLYKNNSMIVDFSFKGAFVSCRTGDFDNYLNDVKEFFQKLRSIMNDVHNLSEKTAHELFTSNGYRHCHPVKNEDKALRIIKCIFENSEQNERAFDQLIGGEKIYQIGLHCESRLFGTIKGNVFRVYFIDYHHDFEYDQRRNTRNNKQAKFCAIKSDLQHLKSAGD